MKLLLIVFLALTLAGRTFAQTSVSSIALTHVTVVDVLIGSAKQNMTVLVVGARIKDVGHHVRIPAGTRIIDATGKYLIPGLWDMHVHTAFGNWFPGAQDVALPLFVANGVTSVRDMGGDLQILQHWRERIRSGTLLGPRMVIAGPMLDGPRPPYPASVPIRNAEQARVWVDKLKQMGSDFIKVQSLIPRDAYFAVSKEANRRGIVFVGHVPDEIRASEASDAGQKSIEHLTGVFEGCSDDEDRFIRGFPKTRDSLLKTYNPVRARELMAKLARNHTWQVPTLVTERVQWLPEENNKDVQVLARYVPKYWERHTWRTIVDQITKDVLVDDIEVRRAFVTRELNIVRDMHHAGIPLLAGTDTAPGPWVVPGFSLHDELSLFVKAGLTPIEALRTATLNPAKFFGLSDQLGTIEAGKIADLVLLDANPMDNIANTKRIAAVVISGRFLGRAELDQILANVERAAQQKHRKIGGA